MKKLFALIFQILPKLKKSNNGYGNGQIRLRSYPVQNNQAGSKRNRFTKLRQKLTPKKKRSTDSYLSPPKKKKLGKKIGTAFFACSLVLLFTFAGGGKKVMNAAESIRTFQISEFTISGNELVSNKKVKEATGIILHQTSLLAIDSDKIERKLLSIPWISHVEVKKNYPSSIEVVIKENIPVALVHKNGENGSQLYYIDRWGTPFLPVIPGGEIDFPVVTGLSEIKDENLKDLALAEVLVFLKKTRGNDPYLPVQSVSEIHVTTTGELVVYLVEYPFPIFFGNGNTKKKYARLVQVLKTLYKKKKGKESISRVEYIQMDYLQDKVLVAESGSGGI